MDDFEFTRLNVIIQEGEYIKTILEDELFIKQINKLKERIYNKWQEAKQPEEIQQLWIQNQALNQLMNQLREPIQLAVQAKEALAHLTQ